MKTFKTTDFYIQVLLFPFTIAAIIISRDKMLALFVSYFIIGGYQLTGIFIHEFNHWFTSRGSARRYYHNTSYAIAICMMLTPLVGFTGVVFFPLLFLAPFMAVYYTWLCSKETFVYLRRPLSILK